jgi:hypothetical protein
MKARLRSEDHMVTREYFQNVWWNTTLQRHPELISDPNEQARIQSAHTAAVNEGLAPGDPDYGQRIAEEMGWNDSRSSPRSIPGPRSAASERKREKHAYGQELDAIENLTDEQLAKISGISVEDYRAARKAALAAGEIGPGKRYS